jgi:hypothetical protein
MREHLAQVVGDPERQRDGQPRAEPHDLHVRDRAQLLEQPAEAVVGEHERIAAGQQHVADLGRRADPVERRRELALLHRPLRLADHALAQAEPAVERALVVDAERDPIAVDADHVLDRRVRDLVERIGEPAGSSSSAMSARPGGGSGTRDRPDPSATRSRA